MNQTRMNQSTSTSNTQNIHTNLFFNPINQIDLTIIIIQLLRTVLREPIKFPNFFLRTNHISPSSSNFCEPYSEDQSNSLFFLRTNHISPSSSNFCEPYSEDQSNSLHFYGNQSHLTIMIQLLRTVLRGPIKFPKKFLRTNHISPSSSSFCEPYSEDQSNYLKKNLRTNHISPSSSSFCAPYSEDQGYVQEPPKGHYHKGVTRRA